MHIYIYMYVCVYIYTCMYVCIYIYTCMYVCVYIYMYMSIYVYMYIYIIYMYTCIHIHICTHVQFSYPVHGLTLADLCQAPSLEKLAGATRDSGKFPCFWGV